MAKFLNLLRLRSFANPGDAAAEVSAINDTQPRLRIDAGGKLTWGDGNASGDTNLYRDGANTLKTDDALKVDSLYISNVQVDVTGAVTDDALVFNGTKFVPTAGGGGGATNLNGLTDVTLTTPTTGQVLKYDGTQWINDTDNAGTTINSIDDIGDVSTPTPSTGDFLKYNGTAWVNDTIDLGTDTTGNYVSDVTAGTGVAVTHTPGEGSSPTVSLNASIDDLNDVTVTSASSGQSLTYNGAAWVNQQVMPSGSITQFAGASAPTGWLTCDGTAVSRTTYAALFSVIGTTYGTGDGSTTFNLPNLKGRIPVGRDAAQTEFDALGETGGAKTHTLSTAELPSHTHTINHDHGAFNTTGGEGSHAHTQYGLNTGIPAGTNGFGIGMLRLNDGGYNYASTVAGAHNHSIDVPAFSGSSGPAGSGNAHNNLQPYIVLNYIIKV